MRRGPVQQQHAPSLRRRIDLGVGFTEQPLSADVRPHALTGTIALPDDARALVVVASSSPLDATPALLSTVGRGLGASGLGVALFDDLLSQDGADPLSPFDVAVLAARLAAITGALLAEPRLRRLPLGYLAAGGAASAAVIAAAEQPAAVGALVLVNANLIAASSSLSALTAPAMSLLSRPCREDAAFLMAARPHAVREMRVLPGPPARAVSPAQITAAGRHVRSWFQRHLPRRLA